MSNQTFPAALKAAGDLVEQKLRKLCGGYPTIERPEQRNAVCVVVVVWRLVPSCPAMMVSISQKEIDFDGGKYDMIVEEKIEDALEGARRAGFDVAKGSYVQNVAT